MASPRSKQMTAMPPTKACDTIAALVAPEASRLPCWIERLRFNPAKLTARRAGLPPGAGLKKRAGVTPI
jgi:hypothetical protein